MDVNGSGTYWVEVTTNNCTATDSVLVSFEECGSCFVIPNAFSPNADGKNDLFRQFTDCVDIEDFKLTIIDRWGQVLYISDDPLQGWDGTFQGKPQEIGTYLYMVEYSFASKLKVEKGNVTLIR